MHVHEEFWPNWSQFICLYHSFSLSDFLGCWTLHMLDHKNTLLVRELLIVLELANHIMTWQYSQFVYIRCFFWRVGQLANPMKIPQIMSAVCLDIHTALTSRASGIFTQPTLFLSGGLNKLNTVGLHVWLVQLFSTAFQDYQASRHIKHIIPMLHLISVTLVFFNLQVSLVQ